MRFTACGRWRELRRRREPEACCTVYRLMRQMGFGAPFGPGLPGDDGCRQSVVRPQHLSDRDLRAFGLNRLCVADLTYEPDAALPMSPSSLMSCPGWWLGRCRARFAATSRSMRWQVDESTGCRI